MGIYVSMHMHVCNDKFNTETSMKYAKISELAIWVFNFLLIIV